MAVMLVGRCAVVLLAGVSMLLAGMRPSAHLHRQTHERPQIVHAHVESSHAPHSPAGAFVSGDDDHEAIDLGGRTLGAPAAPFPAPADVSKAVEPLPPLVVRAWLTPAGDIPATASPPRSDTPPRAPPA